MTITHICFDVGYVEDSGEGRGTVQEAKVIAALRNEFGGHAVKGA